MSDYSNADLLVLDEFDRAWRSGETPETTFFLLRLGVRDPRGFVPFPGPALDLLSIELSHRWRRKGEARDGQHEPREAVTTIPMGESPAFLLAEEYFAAFPGSATTDEAKTRLVLEEYAARLRAGFLPRLESYRGRFPDLWAKLEPQLMSADTARPRSRDDPTATLWRSGSSLGDCPPLPDYEPIQLLGRGGMGVVFLAVQKGLNRKVAVKMTLEATHEIGLKRFSAESEMLAAVRHPNVVEVYEYGIHDNKPYLAIEYCSGGSLADQMKGAAWVPREAAMMIAKIADGVQAAHRTGIIHRDLKPHNVLLTETNEPKVSDFGLARRGVGGELTMTQEIMGSPHYMSPEQARGENNLVRSEADVWALGVMLYELLTGKRPFDGSNIRSIVIAVQEGRFEPPRKIRAEIPRDLELICLKCMSHEPHERYLTAGPLASDLRNWLEGRPIMARPAGLVEKTIKQVRRNPVVSAAVVSVIMALGIGLGIALWQRDRANQEAVRADQKTEVANREALAARKAERVAIESERQTRLAFEAHLNRQLDTAMRDARKSLELKQHAEAASFLNAVPPQRRAFPFDHLLMASQSVPRPVHAWPAHDWGVASRLLSRDGRTLVTSGLDGAFRIWDVESGNSRTLIAPIVNPSQGWSQRAFENDSKLDLLTDLAWTQDAISCASASLRGRGRVWNLKTAEPTPNDVFVHPDARPLLAVASGERHLLFGDDRGVLFLVDTGADVIDKVRRLSLDESPVVRIAFLAPNRWLVGQADGTLSLVPVDLGVVVARARERPPLSDFAVFPDGKSVVVAAHRLAVYAINSGVASLTLADPVEEYRLPQQDDQAEGRFEAVALAPDGGTLAAADDRGRVAAWTRHGHRPHFISAPILAGMTPDAVRIRLKAPLARLVTGLSFKQDGRTLLEVGGHTAIRVWSPLGRDATTRFSVGLEPVVAFDVTDSRRLWVGDANGRLAAFDSVKGTCLASIAAHAGGVVGVGVAKNGDIATAGRDGHIRFWTFADGVFQDDPGRAIEHVRPLRSFALAPDGRTVAGHDDADETFVWNEAPHWRATMVLNKTSAALAETGALAFSSDGAFLALAGPRIHWFDLTKSFPRAVTGPVLVADKGGTALAWNPRSPRMIAVGDTIGRLVFGNPEGQLRTPRADFITRRRPIRGVCFSSDGRLIAAVHEDGRIEFSIPEWKWGEIWETRYERPKSLMFSPEGDRLLLAQRDGSIVIHEAPAGRIASRGSMWTSQDLLVGEQAAWLSFRPTAAEFESDGRLRFLVMRATPDAVPVEFEIRLGQVEGQKDGEVFTHRRWEPCPSDFDPAKTCYALHQSLTVASVDGRLHGFFRRQRADINSYFGELIARPLDGEAVAPAKRDQVLNAWFHLVTGRVTKHKPAILHYSHQSSQLLFSRKVDDGWTLRPVTHPGAGLHAVGDRDDFGNFHLTYSVNRFNQDPTPAVYEILDGASAKSLRRETIDDATHTATALVVDAERRPWISYNRKTDSGTDQLIVACRTSHGWQREVVVEGTGQFAAMAMNIDRAGSPWLVVLDSAERVTVFQKYGKAWVSSLLHDGEQLTHLDETGSLVAAAVNDPQGRPAVLLARAFSPRGWLKLCRPVEHSGDR